MNLSRREFQKSTMAAAAGMGALGLLGACSTQENTASTPSPEATGDTVAAALDAPYTALSAEAITEKTVDFVIVGAGPAGLCAAVKAAENGLSVAVVEKTGGTGGCAKFGMGILAIGTELQKAQGEELDLDAMYNMFTEYTHYRTDCVLMRRYFEESKETLEWIEAMGVEFEEAARYFEKS